MEKALELAARCESEGGAARPKVGCVVASSEGQMVAEGFRGQHAPGEHAEFTVLNALSERDLSEASLYTTLEPCSSRNPPKIPCCQRIIESGIRRVVIGMVDPNEMIRGNGIWGLKKNGIKVEYFDSDLMDRIEHLNKHFIEPHLAANTSIYSPHFLKPTQRRLDDWYELINSIYLDKNFYRTPDSIFSHLVEVVGGLSLLATEKPKPGVVPETFVTKALAWWFALCGKVGIRSVEDLLWCKYPNVCPYCLNNPHNPTECKKIKLKTKDPNWQSLMAKGKDSKRPVSLTDWQNMFNSLYRASDTDTYEITFARFTEELGELSEAVRVFDIAPGFFISEAADLFAWLMKVANVISYKRLDKELDPLVLEEELFSAYPDRCKECRRRICACPPVLAATLGRLAHEGPDVTNLDLPMFVTSRDIISRFDYSKGDLQIGDTHLKVSGDLVADVYVLATHLIATLRSDQGGSIDAVIGSLQNVSGLASVQRVSSVAMHDLLRSVRWLGLDLKQKVLAALETSEASVVRDAVLGYLRAS